MLSLSSVCDFMMGFGKPLLHAKFEITGFIYYGDKREYVFKLQICILSHSLGS